MFEPFKKSSNSTHEEKTSLYFSFIGLRKDTKIEPAILQVDIYVLSTVIK